MSRIAHPGTTAARRVANPFLTYAASFGAAATAYALPWSSFYPALRRETIVFLVTTCAVSLFFGWISHARLRRGVMRIDDRPERRLEPHLAWLVLLLALYAVSFAYAGGIPLVWVLGGETYIYEEFGVPVLHVFTVTLGAVLSATALDELLAGRARRRTVAVLQTLAPFCFALATVSRGLILLLLVTWCFIAFMRLALTRRRIIGLVVSTAALIYGFGVLGDLRTASRTETDARDDLILLVGGATPQFEETGISATVFWTYVYATSPLANFEQTIDQTRPTIHAEAVLGFVTTELLPDFLSKRVVLASETLRRFPELVTPVLTAAGVYSASYAYLGWPGPATMFMALLWIGLTFTALLGSMRSPVAALATLNAFMLFCIFDNMIYFSGMFLQLIWFTVFSVRWSRSRASRRYPLVHRGSLSSA